MAMETQDIIKRSATNPITPAPRARDYKAEVAKLIDVSSCVGCKACQVACSEWNDIRDDVGHCVGVYDNPADLSAKSWTVMRFSETEQNGKLEWLIRKDGCMHCAEPGCLKACPSAGAIIQYANGIVDFQQENCIGCGYCIAGCPFNVPRLNKEDNRVYKCTLCVDRVSVGQEPACVKTCPTGAIHFGTKKEMLEVAEERVAKLKKRGYANAGIYNPPGVGGTHVMYVLHHADQPELYHKLPKEPQIDTSISLWKGALKPLAAAGFIATFAGLIYHYIGIGPNKEVDDDEEKHDEYIEDDCAHNVYRSRLSLDGGYLFLPRGAVGNIVLLSDATVANGNLRHAADGAYSAPVLWGADFCRADVYVRALCPP